ncbi:MAG: hypothetical protein EPN97_02830 [Alphaproteobacteria bacterium]|nr:MAG: hypothetical protein EPN97_02830 [Alphaproteobacteria bacterium]
MRRPENKYAKVLYALSLLAALILALWLKNMGVSGSKGGSGSKLAEVIAQAERGDTSAQMALANAYRHGVGMGSEDFTYSRLGDVPRDPKEALKWYKKLADSGIGPAHDALGKMYERGEAMQADLAEAAWHYRAAVDLRYDRARLPLAEMLREGRGLDKDVPEAIKLFRLVCEDRKHFSVLEREQACKHLGEIFERGEGVPQDFLQAFVAYGLAEVANGGRADALPLLAMQMSGDQIAQGNRMFFEATRNSSVPGGSHIFYLMAENYYYGKNAVPNDFAKAAELFLKAARMGHAEAANYMGTIYMEGRGVEKNPAEAYFWWTISFKRNKDDDHDRLADRSLENRRQAQEMLTKEDIERQEKRAAAWTPEYLPFEDR